VAKKVTTQRRFKAVLERMGKAPVWTAATLPFDPVAEWPERNGLRVKGTVAAAGGTPVPIAVTLIRSLERGYLLLVTQKMQKLAGVRAGHTAEFVLEPDTDGKSAEPPEELTKLLKQERALKKWFETLNYSTRKYISDSVRESKSAEVRVRRAEQWAEQMMLTMEGEVEPPPVLQMAFRRQPLARTGWDSMTANQRRMSLLGIFSCKSPEARAKRVDWILADALKRAGVAADQVPVPSKIPDRRPSRIKLRERVELTWADIEPVEEE
jgi:uncharacterized protein YdeI (YjbR/CyaY-like superfamily)